MAGVTLDDGPRRGGRAPHRPDPAGAADGVGPSRWAAGACTSWPGRASRSSGQPRPVTVHRFDVDSTRGPARLPHRGRVLVGDLHPDAGRRPRAPARRRRPPAGPAPHGHRLVHRGRGRAARRRRAAAAGGGAARLRAVAVDEDDRGADRATGGVLARVRRRRRRGRCWRPTAPCSRSTTRIPMAPRPRRPRRRLTAGDRSTAGRAWSCCAGRVRVACPSVQVITDLSAAAVARRAVGRSPSAPSTASTSATPRWSPRCAGWPPRWTPAAWSSPSTATRPASCARSRRPAC